MSVRIAAGSVEPYTLRLNTPIAGRVERTGWWIRLVDDAGVVGTGEAACWPGFGSSVEAVEVALHCVLSHLSSLTGPPAIRQWTEDAPEARFAFELALADIQAQRLGVSVSRLLSGDEGLPSESIPLSKLVASPAEAKDAVAQGFQALKIKLADGEISRVAAVRRAVGDSIAIRVDANQGWSVERWSATARALASLRVSFVEEPLSDWSPLQRIDGLQWAADESIRDAESLGRVLDSGLADVVVLKPMFLGLHDAVSLGRIALRADKTVIVTHALDSAIGCAGAAHVAAALGLQGGCGLSPALVDDPVLRLPERDGAIRLAHCHGLGVSLPGRGDATASRLADAYAIPHPLQSNALARPSEPAVSVDGNELSWAVLTDRARRAATALMALGIGPTSAVSMKAQTSADAVRDIHALGFAGAAFATPVMARSFAAVTGAAMALRPADERFWPLDEVRLCLTTSGTTGEPKPVEITTGQLLFSAFGSALRLEHRLTDRWLCCLPLNHIGGLSVVYRTALYGTTMELHDGFDCEHVSRALDAGEVTQVSLVPTMLKRLLKFRAGAPLHPNVRMVLLGGAPATEALLAEAKAAKLPIAVTYGMSEAASQVATSRVGQFGAPGEIGPALPFVRVSADDGRLTIRGPVVRGALVANDRGRVVDGVLHIAGRADDAILSGGELIDPVRVESVLRTHPSVRDAVVVGVTDTEWGQRVEAVVVSEQAPAEELRRWCRHHLERFEVPKQIHLVEDIPRGPLGKVSRARVRLALVKKEEREDGRTRADA